MAVAVAAAVAVAVAVAAAVVVAVAVASAVAAVKLILKVLGMNGGFKSLKVYQLAYRLAMEIFEISKKLYKQNM